MARGTVGIDIRLLAKRSTCATPFKTIHIWFFYYLICFCVLTAALAPFWQMALASLQALVDLAFTALTTHW